MRTILIYDDTLTVPGAISRIIGAERFGDIVLRKKRLADSTCALMAARSDCELVHLREAEQLSGLLDRLQGMSADSRVFRLPSAIVPLAPDIFEALISKLPYALSDVVYGDASLGEAPALMRRDHAVALLREPDLDSRRRFLRNLEAQSTRVGNHAHFVDISELSTFLSFMSGATEARHFNHISQSDGVFRKRSDDKLKMRKEYAFFHIADEAMKRFLQPTFDYAEDASSASYAMEHLMVPDAALQLVHHTFTELTFTHLMTCFFAFVSSRGKSDIGVPEATSAGLREVAEKLDRRIDQLGRLKVGQDLDQLLRLAGPVGGLKNLVTRCHTALERGFTRAPTSYLALSHGDPCFSNILYNPEINLFRLIDPRGSETRDEAFLHPYYDVAKFSHSVLGGYDFVNAGLAETKIDGRMRLGLSLDRGGPPSWMKHAFRDQLAAQGWDWYLTRAIEASLFLSMLPLHADAPDKLPAFCLIADSILVELEATT